MLWIRRPSICACHYFRGRSFVGARPPSKCIPCSTCNGNILHIHPRHQWRCARRVNILDEIMPEAGSFYVMDRGYIDFSGGSSSSRSARPSFVVRTKSNVLIQRRLLASSGQEYWRALGSDRHPLTSFESASAYPDALRRVSYLDKETQKRLKFLTNNFVLPAFTIAQTLQVSLAGRIVL